VVYEAQQFMVEDETPSLGDEESAGSSNGSNNSDALVPVDSNNDGIAQPVVIPAAVVDGIKTDSCDGMDYRDSYELRDVFKQQMKPPKRTADVWVPKTASLRRSSQSRNQRIIDSPQPIDAPLQEMLGSRSKAEVRVRATSKPPQQSIVKVLVMKSKGR